MNLFNRNETFASCFMQKKMTVKKLREKNTEFVSFLLSACLLVSLNIDRTTHTRGKEEKVRQKKKRARIKRKNHNEITAL